MRTTALVVLASLATAPAGAQELSGWIDASAAHSRPPTGVALEPSNYGLLGGRLQLATRAGSFQLGVNGGRAAASATGSWVGGSAGGQLFRSAGIFSFGAKGDASGVRYIESADGGSGLQHSMLLASVRPEVGISLAGNLLRGEAVLTRGAWRLVTPGIVDGIGRGGGGALGGLAGGGQPSPSSQTTDGALGVIGGAVSLSRTIGLATVEVRGERYDASNPSGEGVYSGIGGAAGIALGKLDVGAGVRYWTSPLSADAELGFHGTVGTALSEGAYLQAGVQQGVADPVYGSAGTLGASLGLSVRVGSGRVAGHPLPVRIGDEAQGGRRVVFRIDAPQANGAAVAGDFTGWSPKPMRRDKGGWILELVVPPGVHHFSFVLDGEHWTVPDDAPGVVDDGFGRKNATLVIEG